MAAIKQLQENGTDIYPVTKTSAVYADDNKTSIADYIQKPLDQFDSDSSAKLSTFDSDSKKAISDFNTKADAALKNAGGGQENITLGTTSWTGDTAPYSYDLGSAYASKAVFLQLSDSATDEEKEAAENAGIYGGNGSVIYATEKPTIDIPVVLAW